MLTIDAWTASNKILFLAITAHWMTIDFELLSTLNGFERLMGLHASITTLGQVATVDHLTSPNGIPRDSHTNSGVEYLGYHGRLIVSIRVYRQVIPMVTLSHKYGNQR